MTGRCKAMRPELLEAAIRADLAAGCMPAGIIAAVGGTEHGRDRRYRRGRCRSRKAMGFTCMSTPRGPARR